jgi:arylformamidase
MIYDITQPLFECVVYPGDSSPEKRRVCSIENGDLCNLTDISLCVHNGTHVDAPLHFYRNGKGIDQIALNKFIGPAYVARHEGDLTAEDAERILARAAAARAGAQQRILIRGNTTVTEEAAKVFAEAGIDLIGNESQTVGPEDSPMAVHLILLGAEVVLLEGIRLAAVPEGAYFLNCAPINLEETDGAPCRAVLMDSE